MNKRTTTVVFTDKEMCDLFKIVHADKGDEVCRSGISRTAHETLRRKLFKAFHAKATPDSENGT